MGTESLISQQIVPTEHALETGIYLGDKFDVSDKLSISAGVRYNVYNYLGAQTVLSYAPNVPRSAANVTDSTTYGSGKVINTYHAPDIRISARYLLNDNLSIKAGYNTLHQYIHLLSNTTSTDISMVFLLTFLNKPREI